MEVPVANQPKDGGRALFYFIALLGAVAAILTGWNYSYIAPSKTTVVIEEGQTFLTLLFVAWYIVIALGGATVVMAVIAKLHIPMTTRWMVMVHGVIGSVWGLSCLFLLVAEISIAKRNELCKEFAGDQWRDGVLERTCYQGDWPSWYPTYAATVLAFLECILWLGIYADALDQEKRRRKKAEHELAVIIGDTEIPWTGNRRERNAQIDAATRRQVEAEAAKMDAWVLEQMERQRALEDAARNNGVTPASAQSTEEGGTQAPSEVSKLPAIATVTTRATATTAATETEAETAKVTTTVTTAASAPAQEQTSR